MKTISIFMTSSLIRTPFFLFVEAILIFDKPNVTDSQREALAYYATALVGYLDHLCYLREKANQVREIGNEDMLKYMQ